jgi:hypothetical protein
VLQAAEKVIQYGPEELRQTAQQLEARGAQPLIIYERCYGETTVRVRRAYGAVVAASGWQTTWK